VIVDVERRVDPITFVFFFIALSTGYRYAMRPVAVRTG